MRTFCVALYCTACVEMYGDVRYGVSERYAMQCNAMQCL